MSTPERDFSRVVAWLVYVGLLGLFGGFITAEPHNSPERLHWLFQTIISAIVGIVIGIYQDSPLPRSRGRSLAIMVMGILTMGSAVCFVRQAAIFYFLFPAASVLTLVSGLAGKE